MTNVISVEHLTKQYDLGIIGTGTLTRDLERWWARARHKPDPYSLVGTDADNSWLQGSILALNDISFTVHQGEALGIIGKNGAGKSTVLKILSRVTAPTSGVAKVKGRIGSLLEVGTGFHPELTGRENIFLNGAILGMKKDEVMRKFDEIVDFSGVEQFIDTPVKRYSSGMYVRLAFAVAAHLEPEILIVDEVLAVGDAEFQRKCLGKMGSVSEDGRTVLFVSHNMIAMQSLCERVILLKSGKIEQDGSADQVISTYLAETTQGDMSASDLLSIQYREGSGDIRFSYWKIQDELLGEGTTARAGAPCTFAIGYVGNPDKRLEKVDVTLTIEDKFGRAILTSATEFQNASFDAIPENGEFLCHFDSLNLMPGQYRLHLWCSLAGSPADKLISAGYFNVIPADVYRTGKIPRDKHGVMFVKDFHWDVSAYNMHGDDLEEGSESDATFYE